MTTFYLYEDQNESGPFTLEELKQKRISRTTPLREKNSDKWMPAESVGELKDLVAPRKIKRPKDVLPAVAEHVSHLHSRRPKTLYGALFAIAMLSGLSFYTIGKSAPKEVAVPTPPANNRQTQIIGKTDEQKPAAESPKSLKPALAVDAAKEDEAKASRLRWNKLISATNSNYGIGFLGGIKDLSVIVTNRSDYPLDQVVAKVSYVKANGEVWKTKDVAIYAVPAGESKEGALADVGRGRKVKVSLYKVVSRKMKFSYTAGKRGPDPNDPYYKD